MSTGAAPSGPADAATSTVVPLASLVPAASALFWLIKIATTGMGEALADALAGIQILLPAVLGAPLLVIALVLQLRARAYSPVRYWFAVSMVAVVGTVAADGPRVLLAIPLPVLSAACALLVAACFVAWWTTERTLDVHAITTTRRQLFYWATVGATFALGTALGDLTAATFGLGYGMSAVLFAVLICIPWLLHRMGVLPGVPAFWSAYVLTRPLGASIADWVGKPHPLGLAAGDDVVAAVAIVLIAALVGVEVARRRRAVRLSPGAPAAA